MNLNILFVFALFMAKEAMTQCPLTMGNTTTVAGANFELLCNTTFGSEQVFSVQYTATFEDCLTACANLDASVPCVGVQYVPDTYAPVGLSGSLCYIQWSMDGIGNSSTTYHSARLIPSTSPAKNCSMLYNSTDTYTSAVGATFQVSCKVDFGFNDIHLSFATDINACADRCARWNLMSDSSLPRCYGAVLDSGSFGPGGPGDGNQCWLKSIVTPPGTPENLIGTTSEVDAVRLQGVAAPGIQSSCVCCLSAAKKAGIAVASIIGPLLFFLAGFYVGKRNRGHVDPPHPMLPYYGREDNRNADANGSEHSNLEGNE